MDELARWLVVYREDGSPRERLDGPPHLVINRYALPVHLFVRGRGFFVLCLRRRVMRRAFVRASDLAFDLFRARVYRFHLVLYRRNSRRDRGVLHRFDRLELFFNVVYVRPVLVDLLLTNLRRLFRLPLIRQSQWQWSKPSPA